MQIERCLLYCELPFHTRNCTLDTDKGALFTFTVHAAFMAFRVGSEQLEAACQSQACMHSLVLLEQIL
jgi:hypothetical protein